MIHPDRAEALVLAIGREGLAIASAQDAPRIAEIIREGIAAAVAEARKRWDREQIARAAWERSGRVSP